MEYFFIMLLSIFSSCKAQNPTDKLRNAFYSLKRCRQFCVRTCTCALCSYRNVIITYILKCNRIAKNFEFDTITKFYFFLH